MSPFVSGALGALTVLVAAGLARRAAWRRVGAARRRGVRRVLRRLGATPDQERAVLAEADALADVVAGLRGDARALRADLADLLDAPSLDAPRVAAALDARLARAAELRARGPEALARVHAILGPEQRARLAALVRAPRCRPAIAGAARHG
jgi:Spy/CpxP family protein refolding chaperone